MKRYNDDRTSGLPRRRAAAWAVGIAFAAAGHARAGETATLADSFGRALPPVGGAAAHGTLYLELVVNALSTGRIVPVRYRDGIYYARAGDLAQASVRTGAQPDALVDLSRLDGVQVEYESAEQRLKLTVPPDWLPRQTLGSPRLYDRTPAAVSFGLLFNYDVYANSPTLGTSYTSAWTEQRLFDRWGTVTNTGVYRRDYGGGAGGVGSNRYLRYDTFWRYSDQDRLRTYTAGDVITGALSWSSAVRLGACPSSAISRCGPTSSPIRCRSSRARPRCPPRSICSSTAARRRRGR